MAHWTLIARVLTLTAKVFGPQTCSNWFGSRVAFGQYDSLLVFRWVPFVVGFLRAAAPVVSVSADSSLWDSVPPEHHPPSGLKW